MFSMSDEHYDGGQPAAMQYLQVFIDFEVDRRRCCACYAPYFRIRAFSVSSAATALYMVRICVCYITGTIIEIHIDASVFHSGTLPNYCPAPDYDILRGIRSATCEAERYHGLRPAAKDCGELIAKVRPKKPGHFGDYFHKLLS